MAAYYNEHDPKAAAWLRELIKVGAIAPGNVDERDIRDVRPDELAGFDQHHFFAGIGVWSYALRLAGWPDSRPVWTGSCPCQPFSAAGQGGGFDDERHLWPSWFHLIEVCRPGVIFGEQVASKDGLAWLDLVLTDLEGSSYAAGAIDLCAAGVGTPHGRQRLYFVADSSSERLERLETPSQASGRSVAKNGSDLGDSSSTRGGRHSGAVPRAQSAGESEWLSAGNFPDKSIVAGAACCVADADGRYASAEGLQRSRQHGQLETDRMVGPVNGFWRDAEWIPCRDGKYRAVEPGTFPLAHGAPARMGRIRGYGNAIVAQAAAEVIGAYMQHSTS